MRRSNFLMLFTFVLFTLLTTAWLAANSKVAYAQSSSLSLSIDHTVQAMDGGEVVLTDKVQLYAAQFTAVSNFQIGFPDKYKSNLDQVLAYESSNPENKLEVDLDVDIGSPGFYAVRVNFGRDVNLNVGQSYNFTVAYLFSDLITEKFDNATQANAFNLDFPVYPSLAQTASCRSTVLLPSNATFTRSSYPFNQTATGVFSLPVQLLQAFTSEPGTFTFKPIGAFNLLEITELKREVSINDWDNLLVSDSYSFVNKAISNLTKIRLPVPNDAFGISAQDELGTILGTAREITQTTTFALTTLDTALLQNESTRVQVTFGLPWKNYISQSGLNNFNLNFKLFDPMNLTLKRLAATAILPEGAIFQSSNAAVQPNLEQISAFQEKLSFIQERVTSFQNPDFSISYSRIVFWAAFRPTMWTAVAILIIGAIAFLWQLQRGAPTPITTALLIRPEELKNYVKTYDEARKLQRELQSLETQARKGKIPRRLYRVRSRTLESRLSVYSRDLAGLRDKIRGAGSKYAEMMQQIEVAENELKGAEADIRRAEVSYRRGELSAAAHSQSLEGAYKRRDRAQTAIDGILLRLREEAI